MKPGEYDEHLRTALRHAPDAGVVAPADISAQIIAAAHRRAAEQPPRPATPPPRRGWLQTWGASGALASVLMAGTIGLLWRGEAPGPAREEALPEVAQAPARSAAPTLTPVPVPVPTPAPPPAPSPALAPPSRATAPTAKPTLRPMAPEAQESVARDAAVAPNPAPAPERSQPAAAPGANTQRAPLLGAQEQAATAARPPPAAPAAAMTRSRAPADAAAPAPWRTAPQAGDTFSWQPADRLLQPPDAAWLARLAALTAGRWLPAQGPAGAADTLQLQLQLHWQRSANPVGRFVFASDAVWWCASTAGCERAPLDAAALRELLAQIAR